MIYIYIYVNSSSIYAAEAGGLVTLGEALISISISIRSIRLSIIIY